MGADEVIEWLTREGPQASGAAQLLEQTGPRLREHGFPVTHLWHTATVGHPMVNAYAMRWAHDEADVAETYLAHDQLRRLLDRREAPPALVLFEGVTHVALTPADRPTGFDLVDERFAAGATDYLLFRTGRYEAVDDDLAVKRAEVFIHALTLCAPDGFDREGLQRVVGVLDLALRTHAQHFSAHALLRTYLGADAAERVYGGLVQRGDHTRVEAVILFTDLRGFSAMTEAHPPGAILGVLDEAFELQVRAIEAHGGHVLKFMGDGLLAIWPEAPSCDPALDALDALDASVQEANAAREGRGDLPIRYGAALHVGEVVYGNIGAPHRLDFTVVGAAVNRTARLEALGARLGVCPALTEAAARRASRPVRDHGIHQAKGVGGIRVFGVDTDP